MRVQLDSKTDTQWGATYTARQLPKALADQEYALISFGFDDRLVRIAAIGKSFDNDHYGGRVRERYTEL